jgi:hypothetical protein
VELIQSSCLQNWAMDEREEIVPSVGGELVVGYTGRTSLARSRDWLAAASVGEELVSRRGRLLPRSGRRRQDYLCGVAAGAVAKFLVVPSHKYWRRLWSCR